MKESGRTLPKTAINPRIRMFDEDAYRDFLAYFVSIIMMLIPSDESEPSGCPLDSYIKEAVSFCDKWKIDSYHPVFSFMAEDKDSKDCFSKYEGSNPIEFQMDEHVCQEEGCNEAYKVWQSTESRITVSKMAKTTKPAKAQNAGSSVDSPIAIDCDVDEGAVTGMFCLRVFDVEAGSSLADLVPSLTTCSALPIPGEREDGLGSALRRSDRKRKTIYPVGKILEQESVQANLNNNIAALRLLLMERCTKGTDFELNHKLTLVITSQPATDGLEHLGKEFPTPTSIDLGFDKLEENFGELLGKSAGREVMNSSNLSENVLLIRQADVDESAAAIPKDALMDYFISLANTATEEVQVVDASSKGSKRKSKRTERGFTGTFLSSGSVLSSDAANSGPPEETGSGLHPNSKSSETNQALVSKKAEVEEVDSHAIAVGKGNISTTESNITRSSKTEDLTMDDEKVTAAVSGGAAALERKKTASSNGVQTTSKYFKRSQVTRTKKGNVVVVPTDSLAAEALENSQQEDRSRRVDASRRGMRDAVSKMLMQNPDVRRCHSSKCQQAASWAIQQNPNQFQPEKLLDSAYAKYLDLLAQEQTL
jgi:hypothetical protein